MKTWICTTMVDFFGPTQGSARLYAYTKNKGYCVSLKDFNQNIYFKLLSKKYLNEVFEKLKDMLYPFTRDTFLRKSVGCIILNSSQNKMKNMLAAGMLARGPLGFLTESFAAAKNIFSPFIKSKIDSSNLIYAVLSNQEYLVSEIEKSRIILETKFLTLPPSEFLEHFQTLLCGKALIDAAYFPSEPDFGLGFQGTEYRPRVKDILHACQDEHHNFLIPYFYNEVLPLLNTEQPGIVGISVTHTSEFVPAFTLSQMIKSKYPQIHICLGGATITEVAHRIQKNGLLWGLFDSLVLGPGEYAFSELIEHLEKGRDLSTVPNLIYKDSGVVKKSAKAHEFDLNDACTPEYVSLRPKTILPLETASGCYWGKCMFCYYPRQGLADPNNQSNTRVRSIELVLEDLKKLREKYDPSYIGITDSSLHPQRIEQIAEYNLKNQKIIKFSAFIRFEKEFKSRAFCEKIAEGGFLGGQAGLESGSQRVNDIINKGVDLNDVKIILKNFYRAKILIHIYSIVGIPGENKEDARLTPKFLKKYRRMITLDWQIYPLRVLEHSPIISRAVEFGLSTEKLSEDFLMQTMKYDLRKGLSQKESTILSIGFSEKLKNYLHPLSEIMDIESYKAFLLARKSNKEFK